MQLAAREQQQPAYHTQRWGTQLNSEVRWHANLHKQKQTRNPSWGRTSSDYWQKQRNTDISFSGFQSSRDKVLIKVIFSCIRVVQSSPISWMCAQAALCWVHMTTRRRAFSEALLLRSIPLKMPMFLSRAQCTVPSSHWVQRFKAQTRGTLGSFSLVFQVYLIKLLRVLSQGPKCHPFYRHSRPGTLTQKKHMTTICSSYLCILFL